MLMHQPLLIISSYHRRDGSEDWLSVSSRRYTPITEMPDCAMSLYSARNGVACCGAEATDRNTDVHDGAIFKLRDGVCSTGSLSGMNVRWIFCV